MVGYGQFHTAINFQKFCLLIWTRCKYQSCRCWSRRNQRRRPIIFCFNIELVVVGSETQSFRNFHEEASEKMTFENFPLITTIFKINGLMKIPKIKTMMDTPSQFIIISDSQRAMTTTYIKKEKSKTSTNNSAIKAWETTK